MSENIEKRKSVCACRKEDAQKKKELDDHLASTGKINSFLKPADVVLQQQNGSETSDTVYTNESDTSES